MGDPPPGPVRPGRSTATRSSRRPCSDSPDVSPRSAVGTALGVVAATLLAAAPAGAQLRDGFRSTLVERGDDVWSGFQSLGFTLNIRGGTYGDASACTNGYVSLLLADDPNNCRFFSTDLGELAGANGVSAAPFWDDEITTENFGITPGQLGYGAGAVGGRSAFGFTWDGVRTIGTPFLSYFQLVFVDRSDRAAGDFDLEYNYGILEGLNDFVVAGFADDGSFTGAQYLVPVEPRENSRVVQCFVGGSIGACSVVPEPATLALTLAGLGVLGAGAAARRRRRPANERRATGVAQAAVVATLAGALGACSDALPVAPTGPVVSAGGLLAEKSVVKPGGGAQAREYLVLLRPTSGSARSRTAAAATATAELAAAAGATPAYTLRARPGFVVRGSVDTAALARDPRVLHVLRNLPHHRHAYPTTATFWRRGWQWNMQQIRADQAATTGAGRLVCVIDGGVNDTHQDTRGKVVAGASFPGDDPPWAPELDEDGHGTHVGSTVTSNGIGVASVAPGAKLLNANVFGPNAFTSTAQLIDAMAWCVTNKADAINMSVGGNLTRGTPDWVDDSTAFTDATQAARASGTVVVASAGNEAIAIPSLGDGEAVTPAEATGIISVGATAPPFAVTFPFASTAPDAVYDALAVYSNFNSGNDALGPGVTIYAPGGAASFRNQLNVTAACAPSAGPNCADGKRYWSISGTSMASPHVAGMVALISSRTNGARSLARVQAIEACLRNTADPLAGGTPFFGRRRINALRATTEPCPGL